MRKTGYYWVDLKGGNRKRIKANTYNEAVNKVIDTTDYNLSDVIDANPEYTEGKK